MTECVYYLINNSTVQQVRCKGTSAKLITPGELKWKAGSELYESLMNGDPIYSVEFPLPLPESALVGRYHKNGTVIYMDSLCYTNYLNGYVDGYLSGQAAFNKVVEMILGENWYVGTVDDGLNANRVALKMIESKLNKWVFKFINWLFL